MDFSDDDFDDDDEFDAMDILAPIGMGMPTGLLPFPGQGGGMAQIGFNLGALGQLGMAIPGNIAQHSPAVSAFMEGLGIGSAQRPWNRSTSLNSVYDNKPLAAWITKFIADYYIEYRNIVDALPTVTVLTSVQDILPPVTRAFTLRLAAQDRKSISAVDSPAVSETKRNTSRTRNTLARERTDQPARGGSKGNLKKGKEPAHMEVVAALSKISFEPEFYSMRPTGGEEGDENAMRFCGREFTKTELCYSCADCGVNETCAMCATCFHNSVHKNHNYKALPAGTRGLCDCGNPDAWRAHPSCNEHASSYVHSNGAKSVAVGADVDAVGSSTNDDGVNNPTKNVATMCGKELTPGMPAVRCKDCEIDETCCLCLPCFQASEHKDHNFEVDTMTEGTCDCGDVDAWSDHVHCKVHIQGLTHEEKMRGSVKCGKTVSPGESLYRCLECESMPTSALCSPCFEMSEHKFHQSETVTSSGGVCSCGIEEAWTAHTHCSLHIGTAEVLKKPEAPYFVKKFWKDTINDVVHFIDNAMAGCNTGCCFYKSQMKTNTSKRYAVVATFVSNGYPAMIALHMKMTLGYAEAESTRLATRVTSEGRAVVFVGKIDDLVVKRLMQSTIDGIKYRVVELNVAIQEECIVQGIDWLSEICREHPLLREYVCDALQTNLQTRLVNEDKYWKGLRKAINSLYFTSLLIVPHKRRVLAYALLNNYGQIQSQFMQKRFKYDHSCLALTVQFLTSPAIVQGEKGLAMRVTTAILETLAPYVNPMLDILDTDKLVDTLSRGNFMLEDLSYILRSLGKLPWDKKEMLKNNTRPKRSCKVSSAKSWMDAINLPAPHVIPFIDSILDIIRMFQAIDGQARISRDMPHVAYESEAFRLAFDRAMALARLIASFVGYVSENTSALVYSIRTCVGHIGATRKRLQRRDKSAPYKVIFTVYLPLHQLLSALIDAFEVKTKNVSLLWPLLRTQNTSVASFIIRDLVNALAFRSQVSANLWVRNGNPPREVASRYRHEMRQMLYEPQMRLLQMMFECQAENSDSIALELLQAFSARRFLLKAVEENDWDDAVETSLFERQTEWVSVNLLLADMFHLIISTMLETRVSEPLARDIIQWLMLKPALYSTLAERCGDFFDKEVFDAALSTMSEHEDRKRGNTRKTYSLLARYHYQFTPHFAHFCNTERDEAMKKVLSMAKDEGEGANYFHRFPLGVDAAGALLFLKVLKSRTFLCIVTHVLRLGKSENPQLTGTLAQTVFWILVLAVRAQELCGVMLFTDALNKILLDGGGSLAAVLRQCQLGPFGRDFAPLLKFVSQSLGFDGSVDDSVETTRNGATPEIGNKKRLRECSVEAESEDSRALKRVRKAEAVKRRAVIMEKMAKQQKSFLDHSSASSDSKGGKTAIKTDKVFSSTAYPETVVTCIMCQEDDKLYMQSCPEVSNRRAISAIAYIQESGVIHTVMRNVLNNNVNKKPNNFNQARNNLPCGPELFMDGCGHTVHNHCLEGYIDSLKLSRHEAPLHYIENIDVGEFLCPMCKRLGNVLIPYIEAPPPLAKKIDRKALLAEAMAQEKIYYELMIMVVSSIRIRHQRSNAWDCVRKGLNSLESHSRLKLAKHAQLPIEEVMWYTIASIELAGRCGAQQIPNPAGPHKDVDKQQLIAVRTNLRLLKTLYRALSGYRKWSMRMSALAPPLNDVKIRSSKAKGKCSSESTATAASRISNRNRGDARSTAPTYRSSNLSASTSFDANGNGTSTSNSNSTSTSNSALNSTPTSNSNPTTKSTSSSNSTPSSKAISSTPDTHLTESDSVLALPMCTGDVSSLKALYECSITGFRGAFLNRNFDMHAQLWGCNEGHTPWSAYKNKSAELWQEYNVFRKLVVRSCQPICSPTTLPTSDTIAHLKDADRARQQSTSEPDVTRFKGLVWEAFRTHLLQHIHKIKADNFKPWELLNLQTDPDHRNVPRWFSSLVRSMCHGLTNLYQKEDPMNLHYSDIMIPAWLHRVERAEIVLMRWMIPFLRQSACLQVVVWDDDDTLPDLQPIDEDGLSFTFEFNNLCERLLPPVVREVAPQAVSTSEPAYDALPVVAIASALTVSERQYYKDMLTKPWAVTNLLSQSFRIRPELGAGLLPHDYSKLVLRGATEKCKQCDSVPEQTALCMLCGAKVCVMGQCCQQRMPSVRRPPLPYDRNTCAFRNYDFGESVQDCMYGEANIHAATCGNGLGLFLISEQCNIVFVSPGMQHHGKGALDTELAPYIDSHGESGEGLRLGHALSWDEQLADELMSMYLNHDVLKTITTLTDEHGQRRWNRL